MLIQWIGSDLPIYAGRISLVKNYMQSDTKKKDFQNKSVKVSYHWASW